MPQKTLPHSSLSIILKTAMTSVTQMSFQIKAARVASSLWDDRSTGPPAVVQPGFQQQPFAPVLLPALLIPSVSNCLFPLWKFVQFVSMKRDFHFFPEGFNSKSPVIPHIPLNSTKTPFSTERSVFSVGFLVLHARGNMCHLGPYRQKEKIFEPQPHPHNSGMFES